MEDPYEDALAELMINYHELNGSIIDELTEEPSPLEFMRYVARNTPFVVRGAALDWEATKTWTVDYLKTILGDDPVNIAVTPAGNADAPTPYTHSDGTTSLVFAKPHEEEQPFSVFLDYLINQEKQQQQQDTPSEVRYAQTQNDNLRHEYSLLYPQVPRTIPWARVALGAHDADAVNLWIGGTRSVTALHRDNYENVYVQIQGQKHFVLLPPACAAAVNEVELRPGRYRRRGRERGGNGDGMEKRNEEELKLELELELEDGPSVPFAIWDPDKPDVNATKYSHLARPMRVTLNPGDMLYLPCMWYHKVSQSSSPEGVCIAVNYWYDMEFSGALYPLTSFVRTVASKIK
ncbi:hypothetical protein VTJ49DRAFT_4478 [Mycothermus thermophilus]|uniref:JmjC domain-containing protein n=1 Tax=Humicola insolens TaxID=85995 RepID=A0ABR3VLC1_HUMIN